MFSGGSRGGSIASMEPPFEGLPSPKYYMRKRATGATQLGMAIWYQYESALRG